MLQTLFLLLGTLRLYRTRAMEPNLVPFLINLAVRSPKADQQTKLSYDGLHESVKAMEVSIKRHKIMTNTLDWHLSLAICQVDG